MSRYTEFFTDQLQELLDEIKELERENARLQLKLDGLEGKLAQVKELENGILE